MKEREAVSEREREPGGESLGERAWGREPGGESLCVEGREGGWEGGRVGGWEGGESPLAH